MANLRRRHVQTAQYIEVRDQPFYYVKTWKKNHVTNTTVPKDLGLALPGQVLVAVYEPKTGEQTFEVAESMAAVHAQYVHEDEDAVVHPPLPPRTALPPWRHPDDAQRPDRRNALPPPWRESELGSENPRLRFLDIATPRDT